MSPCGCPEYPVLNLVPILLFSCETGYLHLVSIRLVYKVFMIKIVILGSGL